LGARAAAAMLEILHYNQPVIRFFLQSEVVYYIMLDLPKAR